MIKLLYDAWTILGLVGLVGGVIRLFFGWANAKQDSKGGWFVLGRILRFPFAVIAVYLWSYFLFP